MLAALLAGCGGGGDDTSESPSDPSANDPHAPPTADATCALPDFTNAVMARVNQWRASGADCGSEGRFGAAAPLAWNASLAQAAAGHSKDMVANNFFSHTGSNGSSMGQRITATGYHWGAAGENIAAGQSTVQSVVDGWIASPGHCANIMNPAYQHVGVACVKGTSSNAYPTYWTMDLAKPG